MKILVGKIGNKNISIEYDECNLLARGFAKERFVDNLLECLDKLVESIKEAQGIVKMTKEQLINSLLDKDKEKL